ncbi:DUF3265 domain-containing protein [Vibrio parahaemolyticus]|nr:DUF3265 domain-containing protein [Vibrio parahaemolyticus]MCG6442345.1 DUF3265 domain-containing protein [Vibrio parahaemolyticus]MCG6454861.1 DUF3265 domain-containing protein [Vibrio parahaemolyticus]
MTNNLRGIPNAWHFASTSNLVFTVQCLSWVVALLTP